MRILPNLSWPQVRNVKPLVILLTLLALFIFTLSFSIGFFTSFPHAVLRDRVLSEVNGLLPAGNRLEAESVDLVFPLQLQLSNSRLIMESAPLPELILQSVKLSPTFATMLGRPGLNVSARSDFGALEGTVAHSGEVDLHLRDGRFDLQIPDLKNIRLAGVVSAIDLVGQLQGGKDDSVRFESTFDNLVLIGAEQLGLENELALGQLTSVLSGSGRSLQIDKLSLSGGVVAMTGAGKIILQQPFDASRLDLKLNLRPEAGADSGLRTLFELLGPPERDGSHTVQLRGRLLSPQLK